MSNKCEAKVAMICKQNGIGYQLRPLKFGFERMEIDCENYEIFSWLRDEIKKVKGTAVDSATHFIGKFSGVLCVMDEDAEAELLALLKEERDRVEDWWQRYHVADKETRRLMACGAIS